MEWKDESRGTANSAQVKCPSDGRTIMPALIL